MKTVSASSLSAMVCPSKWFYGYKERISSVTDSQSISVGKLFHDCIAEVLKTSVEAQRSLSPQEVSFVISNVLTVIGEEQLLQAEEASMVEYMVLKAYQLFQGSFKVACKHHFEHEAVEENGVMVFPAMSKVEEAPNAHIVTLQGASGKSFVFRDATEYRIKEVEPLVEWEFDIALSSERNFVGRVDVVAFDKAGALHVLDWKTSARPTTGIEKIEFSDQFVMYAYAVHELLGQWPDSLTVINVKQFQARVPEATKDGKRLYKWTTVASDKETYLGTDMWYKARKSEYPKYVGLSPEEIAEVIEYYDSLPVVTVDSMLLPDMRIRLQALNNSLRLLDVYEKYEQVDDVPMFLNSFTCSRCPFQELCATRLVGGNYIDLIDGVLFTHKDNVEETEELEGIEDV